MYEIIILIRSFNTYQTLFHQQAEDDRVAYLSEALEDLSSQVRVLDHIIQLGVIVAKYTGRTVVVSQQLAGFGHNLG